MIPYAYVGPFRVYFNRHNEFPKVWSVDCGTQETETPVEAVYFVNLPTLNTEYIRHGKPFVEGDKFVASAIVTGRGLVRVEGDCAFVDGGLVPGLRPKLRDLLHYYYLILCSRLRRRKV